MARLWLREAQAAVSATLTVNAPGTSEPIAVPFTVTVDLSGVTFDTFSPNWWGYDFELSYDPSLLNATGVSPTLCQNPSADWVNPTLTPHVVTGCALQTSTARSGVLETVSFACKANGTSLLTLVPRQGAGSVGSGTAIFDARPVDFAMTLNSGYVDCGTGGGTPTFTASPTGTPTGTPTFAFTPGPTPTVPLDAPAGAATTYQLNALHDGAGVGALPMPPAVAWHWDLTAFGAGSPLVVNGRVFISVPHFNLGRPDYANLYAFDAQSGSVLWGPIELSGGTYPDVQGIAADAGNIYVVNWDGLLRVFDQSDSQELWRQTLPGGGWYGAPPVVKDGRIFMDGFGGITAVDLTTHAILWHGSPWGGAGQASPAVTDDGVYTAEQCGNASRQDPASGQVKWSRNSGVCYSGSGVPVAVHQGRLYIADPVQTPVILSIVDGSVLGQFSQRALPAFDGNVGFFTPAIGVPDSGECTLAATDLDSLSVLWSQPCLSSYPAPPIVADGKVIIAFPSGQIAAYDEQTGAPIWSEDFTDQHWRFGPLAESDGMIFAGDGSGIAALGPGRPIPLTSEIGLTRSTILAGGATTLTITLSNPSAPPAVTPATQVVATMDLPAVLLGGPIAFAGPGASSCTFTSPTVLCNVGTLEQGGVFSVTVSVNVAYAVTSPDVCVIARTTSPAFLSPQDACAHVKADSDRDGCSDEDEVRLGLDPSNPWDFYSVPVPALFAATSPLGVLSDTAVTSADAQAVFAYFKKGAKVGTLEYEQDLNGDGVKDGVEYDRSYLGVGRSGAPDGIVTASDAQLAFAQFKMGYHC